MSRPEFPKDPAACLDFESLAEPVVEAVRAAYELERRNRDADIPWTGPENTLPAILATCLTFEDKLKARHLRFSLEDQGRSALEEIVEIAIRLGIEQGYRQARGKYAEKIKLLKMAVSILESA